MEQKSKQVIQLGGGGRRRPAPAFTAAASARTSAWREPPDHSKRILCAKWMIDTLKIVTKPET